MNVNNNNNRNDNSVLLVICQFFCFLVNFYLPFEFVEWKIKGKTVKTELKVRKCCLFTCYCGVIKFWEFFHYKQFKTTSKTHKIFKYQTFDGNVFFLRFNFFWLFFMNWIKFKLYFYNLIIVFFFVLILWFSCFLCSGFAFVFMVHHVKLW